MLGFFRRRRQTRQTNRNDQRVAATAPVNGTKPAAAISESERVHEFDGSAEWQEAAESTSFALREANGMDRHPARSEENGSVRYQQGSLIGGRYEVLEIFGGPGKSGMGVVYKCYDRWDRRLCAVKSFQDQPVWDARAAKTFRREAECWIGLGHHPHVVAALTIRRPDGRLYLVLEYIAPDDNGRNCLTHYLEGKPLPVEQTLKWAIQTCWGMEHAASHGIRCHRDIKPDNLMIDREGQLKISDFGLAKALDGLSIFGTQASQMMSPHILSLVATREGTACGSPPWMAPEQFGGAKDADVRNDVYSFGVVLFQMLSGGALPFQASTIRQYAELHRRAPVPPLKSPLAPVVEKCLNKRPEDRYPNFTALRGDLEKHACDLHAHVPEYQELRDTSERLKDLAASFCYLASQEPKKDQRNAYYEKALLYANQAVETDAKLVAARINRSLCYLSMSDEALKRDDVREANRLATQARDSAQEALDLDPDSALAFNNLACACRNMQQWDQALAAARQAVKLDSEFLDGWNTLGGLCHSQAQDTGEYRHAIECYEKAVHIDPFFFDGYMNLGDSYCGVENAEEALKCYERAAEIDPDNTEAAKRRDAFRAALRRK